MVEQGVKCVFIVNFEHISQLVLVEQVNVGWINVIFPHHFAIPLKL